MAWFTYLKGTKQKDKNIKRHLIQICTSWKGVGSDTFIWMENKKEIEIYIYDVMLKSVITCDVGAGVVVIIYGTKKVVGFTPITTKVVSSNPVHDEVY